MQITSQYAIALLLSAAISLALSLYVLRRRSAPGSKYFAFLMIAVAEWSIAAAFEAYFSDAGTKILLSKISYLGIASTPTFFILFALSHTRRGKATSRRNAALLCIMPVATIAMAFTNDFHGLLWSSFSPGPAGTNILIYGHGAWFWINVAYSYAMMLGSTTILALKLAKSSKFYRRQTATVLIGSLVPWIGNAIYIFGFSPIPGLDFAPVFFSICGIIITLGIYRFGLFNIVPVAREVLFNSMRSGVIVLDGQGRIVEINPAARKILEIDVPVIGKTARDALPELIGNIPDFDSELELNVELCLEKRASPACLDVSVSPLYDNAERPAGRLLILRDITEHKKAEDALRESE
ncbi:MAG: histidine kinase N-terminal 7TM domain-containing protein, partial [Candidatus Thermoplasmatota archaeon]|nr:histidine kinase N-terminal 7TM domain-containing protein [Candidatus Thermoplasmatota archaeon]